MDPKFVWTTLPASVQGDSGLEAEHAGNRTLDDILPHWERSMTLTPKDPLEQAPPVRQPDYPKYESMMQHWESFVNGDPPPEVHLYWEEGLAEAKKRFTLGPRPINEVSDLVGEVIMEIECDLVRVESTWSAAHTTRPVLEQDMCETLPLALARLMGMGPPQDDEFSETSPRPCLLWEDYFAPKMRQQKPDSKTQLCASGLVAAIRDSDMDDLTSIRHMKLRASVWYRNMKELLNTDHYANWMKKWEEEFPEVVAPYELSVEFMMHKAMVEAKIEAVIRGELGYPEYGEGGGEAANGEGTGKEVALLHAPPEMVPEGPLGGMEPFDEDWEDAMDMA